MFTFFKLYKEFNPDLVLVEFLLPGINGGEICYQLKNLNNYVPVIIMSTHKKVFRSLGTYGCDDFIEKPFSLADLLNCIDRHLTLKKDA